MRRLIRAKKKDLRDFEEYIRKFKFPVVALHKIVSIVSFLDFQKQCRPRSDCS